jgi:molybdopterin converting factor small subunit
MFGFGEDNQLANPLDEQKGFFDSGPDDKLANPLDPPEEPSLLGIPRGLKSGLQQGVGVIGGAMQTVSPEGSAVSEAGKSLTDYAEANVVPAEEEGFLEKGAKMLGLIAPLAIAGAVAPGTVAPLAIGAAGAGVFGLSQAHETKKAMEAQGLDPGLVPVATGAVTAVTMMALPMIFARTFSPAVAKLVGANVAKQTVGEVMRPSAAMILKDYAIKATETQGLFAGQTLGISGIEKMYGVPHDIAQEMWASAESGLALSVFGAAGMPVRRMVDNAHLKMLAEPWKPADIDKIPEEKRVEVLQKYAETRAGYVEAIGSALDNAGNPIVASKWREYAIDKIKNNEAIKTDIALDQISLDSEMLQNKVARDMGLTEELKTDDSAVKESNAEVVTEVAKTVKEEPIMPDEETPLSNLEDLSALEAVKPPESSVKPKEAQVVAQGENVAQGKESIENPVKLTPEQKITAWDAKEAIHGMLKGKVGKTPIILQVAKYQAENPNITTDGIIKRYIAESGAALVKGKSPIVPEVSQKAPIAKAESIQSAGEPKSDIRKVSPEIKEISLDQITLSKDVPQFKSNASDKGIVEPLAGKKYDRLPTNPIVLWERTNGALEIVTGRHRYDLAKRTGEKTIPAQVVREADGFTKQDALTFDAEQNIKDNQGSNFDYANYFRNTNITAEEAKARGLLRGEKANTAFLLGKSATDSTFNAYRIGQIGFKQAKAIAEAAPKNEALQNEGLRYLLHEGKRATELEAKNYVEAISQFEAVKKSEQGDLFGYDDSAIRTAAEMSKKVSKIQSALRKDAANINAAISKSEALQLTPEAMKRYGITDGKNKEQLKKAQEKINVEIDKWDKWATNPELVAELKGEQVKPEMAAGEKKSKEPWEMTRDEFVINQGKDTPYVQQQRDAIVKQAVKEGKSVPEEVLKDYPELNKPKLTALKEKIAAKKTVRDDVVNKIEQDSRELSKADEVSAMPVKDYNLTTAEQQELIKRGLTFDVDRMGNPLVRLSKETRIKELRNKVTSKKNETVSLEGTDSFNLANPPVAKGFGQAPKEMIPSGRLFGGENPLIEEAKKYKSADEFVKAQVNQPLPDNPQEGYIRVYRGVNPDRNISDKADPTHGDWFTTTHEDAVSYANWDYEGAGELRPDGSVVAIDIPIKDALQYAQKGSRRKINSVKELLDEETPVEMQLPPELSGNAKHYDGNIDESLKGMRTSDLTSIWNKAQEKNEPITPEELQTVNKKIDSGDITPDEKISVAEKINVEEKRAKEEGMKIDEFCK